MRCIMQWDEKDIKNEKEPCYSVLEVDRNSGVFMVTAAMVISTSFSQGTDGIAVLNEAFIWFSKGKYSIQTLN